MMSNKEKRGWLVVLTALVVAIAGYCLAVIVSIANGTVNSGCFAVDALMIFFSLAMIIVLTGMAVAFLKAMKEYV